MVVLLLFYSDVENSHPNNVLINTEISEFTKSYFGRRHWNPSGRRFTAESSIYNIYILFDIIQKCFLRQCEPLMHVTIQRVPKKNTDLG